MKIRDLERKIKTSERFTPNDKRDARLTRWRARLAELKESAVRE